MSPEGTAFALRDRGLPIATIAREIGISRSTVGEWLKGYGETFYDLRCEAEGCGRPFVAFTALARLCEKHRHQVKPPRVGNCARCGARFETHQPNRKYCDSSQCSSTARPPRIVTCQKCGVQFTTRKPQKYCNDPCRNGGKNPGGGLIDVAPVREAYLRSGVADRELARRLGWTKPAPGGIYPDSNRVRRTLAAGKMMQRLVAIRVCEALGVDPLEVVPDA